MLMKQPHGSLNSQSTKFVSSFCLNLLPTNGSGKLRHKRKVQLELLSGLWGKLSHQFCVQCQSVCVCVCICFAPWCIDISQKSTHNIQIVKHRHTNTHTHTHSISNPTPLTLSPFAAEMKNQIEESHRKCSSSYCHLTYLCAAVYALV